VAARWRWVADPGHEPRGEFHGDRAAAGHQGPGTRHRDLRPGLTGGCWPVGAARLIGRRRQPRRPL